MINYIKKKIFFIFVIFLATSIQVSASELDTTSQYFQELMQDQDYSAIFNASQERIDYLNQSFVDGAYTEEEYNLELEKIINSRDKMLNAREQEILRQKQNEEANKIAAETEKVEGFADQTGYDENGNFIKDYTNVDFSNLPNKRTLTIKGILEEGTATKSNFYIKVNVSARNLIYETTAIMDESNNYNVTIPVPNDIYYVYYDIAETEDLVGCEAQLIDVRLNPTIEISITGAIKIDSNEGELILIEGEEYTEITEKDSTFNAKPIIIGSIIAIIIIGLGIGTFFIIKIKKENEI